MRFCLTLAESSPVSAARKISCYAESLGLIEVRLDFLKTPELPSLPRSCPAELIATCRPLREGGKFEGGEEQRLELLGRAARAGFRWVDLEHDVASALDLPSSTGLIRSLHCFGPLPADLDACLNRLRRAGGEVLKLAFRVESTRELVRLLEWSERLGEDSVVIVGMGEMGRVSRFLAPFAGSRWTYVCESRDRRVAEGQIDLHETAWYSHLKERPRLYGVLGNPIEHSLSPALHNALFRRHGYPGLYLPILLDDVTAWLEYSLRSRLPFEGFSVTRPFKTAAARYLGVSDPINTLIREGRRWRAENTDRAGFLAPLERRLNLCGKSALILGTGGVARTAARALLGRGARVTVAGRDPARSARLAEDLKCRSAGFSELPVAADLYVNATPVGQYPDDGASPLATGQIQCSLLYDLVYRPRPTRLMRLARERGSDTVSGIEMFVEQAALQFAAWTGIDPDRNEMLEIIENEERRAGP